MCLHVIFSPTNDEKRRSRKRKQQTKDNLEETYEKTARKTLGPEKQMKAVLPIKTKDKGIVPQSVEVEDGTVLIFPIDRYHIIGSQILPSVAIMTFVSDDLLG